MAEIIELEDQIEKVILVGVSEQDGDDAEDSVAELAELVRTAGAVVVGTLIQKRELMHPGTYVGTGKVAEIAAMIAERGATGIVCDDELSPASGVPCPDSAAESEREGRVRKSWRWTDVSSKTASHS